MFANKNGPKEGRDYSGECRHFEFIAHSEKLYNFASYDIFAEDGGPPEPFSQFGRTVPFFTSSYVKLV